MKNKFSQVCPNIALLEFELQLNCRSELTVGSHGTVTCTQPHTHAVVSLERDLSFV